MKRPKHQTAFAIVDPSNNILINTIRINAWESKCVMTECHRDNLRFIWPSWKLEGWNCIKVIVADRRCDLFSVTNRLMILHMRAQKMIDARKAYFIYPPGGMAQKNKSRLWREFISAEQNVKSFLSTNK